MPTWKGAKEKMKRFRKKHAGKGRALRELAASRASDRETKDQTGIMAMREFERMMAEHERAARRR